MDTPRPWNSVSSQSATSTSWNADDGRVPHIPRAAPFFRPLQSLLPVTEHQCFFATKYAGGKTVPERSFLPAPGICRTDGDL